MKVLLVSANTERTNMIAMPLGLGLVCAAARRRGHDVAFLDLLREPDARAAIRRAVASTRPQVIGISVRNIDDQSLATPRFLLEPVRDVVAECHASSPAPVVVGGAGYSIFPREALAYLGADLGIAGDGETAFAELLDRMSRGEAAAGIPGLHAGGPGSGARLALCDDLDAEPTWDDALAVAPDPDLWIPVQSRRGCPNDCSYCSTSRVQGRRIRARSPERVVETVRRLSAQGHRQFFFVDNSFNIPESHALDLCERLAALSPRPTWRCILYPERVGEELVRAMAAAGCTDVSLGFESGCERILREMNKRFTPEDVRRTSELLAAHGMRRLGFLLLGGPGETRESVEQSLAFARSLRLDDLRITVGIRIYPGTPLARRARAEGVIQSEDELLRPRFYLEPGLAPWIHDRTAAGP